MNKKLITLTMVLAFVAGTAAVSFAIDCKGVAKIVQGATVTVLCNNGTETTAEDSGKGSAKIGIGDKVVVKGTKVRKEIEGC